MKLNTIYPESLSLLPPTMSSSINYKDTLFELINLTPIRGEATFKTLLNLRNEIKANENVSLLQYMRTITWPSWLRYHKWEIYAHL